MSKEEIALQLTLKSIEYMDSRPTGSSINENNSNFSKQVCDFYNYLYKNLDNTITV